MASRERNEAVAWHGQDLPSHWVMRVAAAPLDVLVGLSNFLDCVIDAEVEECKEANSTAAWSIHAIAFMDYVALGIEVSVYQDPDNSNSSVIVFKHTTQQDIVRFAGMCALAIEHLRTNNMDAQLIPLERAAPKLCGTTECFDDDFEEDFPPGGEKSWPQLISSVLDDLVRDSCQRREALQTLARWAETRDDCRGALADALRHPQHRTRVQALFQGPTFAVDDLYPLAVAIRFASGSFAEASVSTGFLSSLLPNSWPQELPRIVARQLTQALNRSGTSPLTQPGTSTTCTADTGQNDVDSYRASFEIPSEYGDDASYF